MRGLAAAASVTDLAVNSAFVSAETDGARLILAMSNPVESPLNSTVIAPVDAPVALSAARGAYAVANGVLTLAFGLLTFISLKVLITKKLATLRQRLFFIFLALACVGTFVVSVLAKSPGSQSR